MDKNNSIIFALLSLQFFKFNKKIKIYFYCFFAVVLAFFSLDSLSKQTEPYLAMLFSLNSMFHSSFQLNGLPPPLLDNPFSQVLFLSDKICAHGCICRCGPLTALHRLYVIIIYGHIAYRPNKQTN